MHIYFNRFNPPSLIVTRMRKRLLLVHHNINPPAGGAGVAAWGIEALKDDYEVTVLTWQPINIDNINRYYGTRLKSAEFKVFFAPSVIRWLYALDPEPNSIQPIASLMRIGRFLNEKYDAVLTFNNEMDLGEPIIQYIHYPYLAEKINIDRPPAGLPFLERIKLSFKHRWRPWLLISGFNRERMLKNLTLVNSDWTGEVVRKAYGISSVTVYPPIEVQTAHTEWECRENSFVAIGRIDREKSWARIIEILSNLRQKGYDIRLHIVGSLDATSIQSGYYQEFKQLILENSAWVKLVGNISRMDLFKVIAKARYGIHAREEEHFGMAVAEMTMGGCVVFAPNNGGQTEILAKDTRLLFDSADDAVQKIANILDNPEAQHELQAKLLSQAQSYSLERFIRQMREVVREHITHRQNTARLD